MSSIPSGGNSISTDVRDLASLRESAKQNSPEALKATAQKFEAMFVNMVLKSMRDATPKEGPFDSEQSKMFTSMLDQELSQSMARRGVGLADVLVRQLSTEKESLSSSLGKPVASDSIVDVPHKSPEVIQSNENDKISAYEREKHNSVPADSAVRKFRDRVSSAAEAASRETGIPAEFIVAQAALESGWGKREVKNGDGSSSNNVFGIKASSSWKGSVAEVVTTEYQDGVARKTVASFRSYENLDEAFADYAKLLKENRRYENVLGASSMDQFASGLQQAGYATDPMYAHKLKQIVKMS
jgi:flagellar protein FlgJ